MGDLTTKGADKGFVALDNYAKCSQALVKALIKIRQDVLSGPTAVSSGCKPKSTVGLILR